MAKLTKEVFIQSLKEMNIKEVMKLVEAMKEEFGIDPTAIATAAEPASQVKEEAKDEVTITLKAIGENKVAIIKVIKEITGAGLMDAKKITESAPVAIKENIKLEVANEIKDKLEKAGAEVEIT